jgi:type II secretory pathway pseudopilin PulG
MSFIEQSRSCNVLPVNPNPNEPIKTYTPMVRSLRVGITLIETLVVIAISFVLIVFILTFFDEHSGCRSRMTSSVCNAKRICFALRLYAEDNKGKYPSLRADGTRLSSGDSSNRALEQLLGKYVPSKSLFQDKMSAWCSKSAEDKLPEDANILKRGQNDWNYVVGLTVESDSRWPLVATATASATELTYTNVTTAKGGLWGGTDTVVGFPDCSVRQMSDREMNLQDKSKTFPKRADNGANIFIATPDWLGTERLILAPE